MSMAIRQAAPADSDAIFDLERYAYDYPSEHVKLVKTNFENNFNEYYVLEDEGKVVGAGRLVCFEQNIRKSWRTMGGLGELATSPEIRRQGYARDLMDFGIELMYQKGYSTSMLYPFKDTFYSAFGFINCPPILSVSVNPIQLRGCKKPHGYSFQRAPIKEGLDFFKSVHDKSTEEHHGAVRRSDKRWEEMVNGDKYEIVIVFGKDGEPEGLMMYQNKGYSQFGDSKNVGTMIVREWYCLSCRARTAMLNYIYLHADQIVNVSIPINPMSDDYYHWVQDRNIPTIRARRSYMARVIDLEKAIEGIPSSVEGEVCLQVQDKHCDWNHHSFRFYQKGNSLHVEQIEDTDCDTMVTIEGITALVYGTAHVDTLVCFGWIDGPVPPILSQWFPKADMWMTEDF
jgi:predicted acetyltransferase